MKDVGTMYKKIMQATPEFYELEPAEVIECWLDEEDLPLFDDKPDWSKYGWAKVRMTFSNGGKDDYKFARPLDSNIRQYPFPGEIVIVATYLEDIYYTQKLNVKNQVSLNMAVGLSKITKFWEQEEYKENLPTIGNTKIRFLDAEEGDITFEGRFGNTIRLGSNVKEIKTQDGVKEDTGKENSPNIIIRSGQRKLENPDFPAYKPIKEDINLDGSSVWMTTDQKVDIKLDNSHSTFIWADKGSEGFGGNRITINSDGLIFNSKKNNILMSSMGFIGLTANTEIGIEVPNDTGRVYLGDGMADQPVLGGDQTMELFGLLVDYLIEFTNQLAPAMGSIINFPVPIPHIPISCSSLVTKLQTLKTRIDEPKSKTVHVGHLRGPE
jgi:hypothetical protein